MFNKNRCTWCLSDPLYIQYHDEEWGTPLHDAQKLFEFILLEGMQAGLSWLTILKKREAMRKAFHGFNPVKLALLNDNEIENLKDNPNIIRNHLKIASTRKNALAFLKFQEQNENMSEWLWQFTDGKTIQNAWKNHTDIPTTTKESDQMAKALKKRGFAFVGSTTCYAFMQATGMVNDHLVTCYRHHELTPLTQ
jgi:DNA-3-methyladenine glycosylase I